MIDGGRRPSRFCLVPADRADALLAPLREYFAGEPSVAVLVEQRAPDRNRRPPHSADQRRPRAPVAERDPRRALPPDLRDEARGLRFVQRLEPLGRTLEDADTSELVELSRANDAAAVSELWWRYSQRVQMRLRAHLGDLAAATAMPHVLGRVLDELDRHDLGTEPLAGWLDSLVDRYADECAESPRARVVPPVCHIKPGP